MKIVTPPAINNLDELLDVVLHPNKLKTALTQMAEMRKAIEANIDIYTTKQKADEYLTQAQTMQRDVQQVLDVSRAKALDHEAQRKARLEQLTRDQEAWMKAKEQEQAAFKARRDDLTAKEHALQKQAVTLNALAVTLQQREAELTRLSTKLTAELDKMEQRKALLNAV